MAKEFLEDFKKRHRLGTELIPPWTQFLRARNKLDHTSYHWGVLAGGPELGGYTIIYTILYSAECSLDGKALSLGLRELGSTPSILKGTKFSQSPQEPGNIGPLFMGLAVALAFSILP